MEGCAGCDSEKNCVICSTDYDIDENVINLNCKHTFHPTCLQEWVMYKSECPMCRSNIYTVDNNGPEVGEGVDDID